MRHENDIPLVMGTIRGWRGFRLRNDGTLTGVFHTLPWRDGENHSRCVYRSSVHNFAPNCSCGFYAYFPGSADFPDGCEIAGVIEGYGDVQLNSKGFRCSKARIVALFLPTLPSSKYKPWQQKRTHYPSFWYTLIAAMFFLSVVLFTAAFAVRAALLAAVLMLLAGVALGLGIWAHTGPLTAVLRANKYYENGACAYPYLHRVDRCNCSKLERLAIDASPYKPNERDENVGYESLLTPQTVGKIMEKYPSAKVYHDIDEMLSDYPPEDVHALRKQFERDRGDHTTGLPG